MNSSAKFVILFLLLFSFLFGFAGHHILFPPRAPVDLAENQAVPLNDREYFREVKNLIDSANHSIHVIIFDINYYPDYPESPSNSLLLSLSEAASRGIDVRIITDERPTDKPVVTMLKEKGVNIKFDSKDVTSHAKLIIIDSKIVIIGSTNWSYHSLEKNHEANVLIRSPSLAGEFENYFETVWAES